MNPQDHALEMLEAGREEIRRAENDPSHVYHQAEGGLQHFRDQLEADYLARGLVPVEKPTPAELAAERIDHALPLAHEDDVGNLVESELSRLFPLPAAAPWKIDPNTGDRVGLSDEELASARDDYYRTVPENVLHAAYAEHIKQLGEQHYAKEAGFQFKNGNAVFVTAAEKEAKGREIFGSLVAAAREAYEGSDEELSVIAASLPALKVLAARTGARTRRAAAFARIPGVQATAPATRMVQGKMVPDNRSGIGRALASRTGRR